MPELITEPPPSAPLIVYEPNEAAIARVREEFHDLIADPNICKTPEGYDRVKAALKVTTPMRTAIEKARVQQKAASLDWGRKVDAEAKRLTARVLEIEEPLKARKDAVDAEAECAARQLVEEQMRQEEAERKRVEDEKQAALAAEREWEAAARRAEREQIERERAEWKRQRDAEAEAARIEREKVEAQRRQLAEAQAAIAAEQKAEADRIAAERSVLRAEQERADRIKFEAEARARAEEQAKADADRRVKEAAERAEREQREAAAREKHRQDEEAAARRAEEEARPDAAKIKAFGEALAAFADESKLSVKTANARKFVGQMDERLATIILKCRGYKTR